jgi:hypothetical protein
MEMLAENPDLAHSKKRLFEVSRRVQAAYDASRGGGKAAPARKELSKKEGAEALMQMVEQHYAAKVQVESEEELETMYEKAILEMGLADILLPSWADVGEEPESASGVAG